MKTTKELLGELLEEKEWGFNYHSERHEQAQILANASCEINDLKEVNNQANKDMEYHYNKMIKEQEYIHALKSVL